MNLRALQRDFRAWLTQESAEAAARLSAGMRPGPGLDAGGDGGEADGDSGAAPGLSVYLNTYRGQLLACLAGTFGNVRACLGETAFDAAAATHVDRVPPGSWTLDAYGQDFPSTLDALYPGDPWIGELAQLDLEVARVFVGPDSDCVVAADLGEVDWDRAVLRLVRTFTTLSAATNALDIRSALEAGTSPPPASLLPGPVRVALWRREFTPHLRALDGAEAQALEHVAAGMTFGALCAGLVERHGAGAGPALAGAWLGRWVRDGMIAAVNPAPS